MFEMTCGRLLSTLLLLFVLPLDRSVVHAQERPKYTAVPYDSFGNYRQNVCDRHEQYYNGEIEMRDALAGLDLNIVIDVGRLFPLKDGAIDDSYPGIIGVLLDELAKRASFTWRNSFAVTYGPGEGRTYTDLFLWGTNAYDLYADWMTRTIERLKMGLGSPEGFYDASFILIGKKPEAVEQKASLFNWLKPFDAKVWWSILATIIGSAIFYAILEILNHQDNKHEKLSFVNNLFFSSLVFSQHFMFMPKSHAARIFSASMAFWSLITVSTYTANLASFFVVQNTPPIQINSIDDAIQAKMLICIWNGSAAAEIVAKKYDPEFLVGKTSEESTFEGIANGECDFALSSVTSWEQFEKDRGVNGDCDLTWIGRVIKFVDAGFAIKNDAGVLCTTLIQNVLNIHLVEMHADGFIESAWQEYFRKNQDIDCNAVAADSTEDAESLMLTWNQMAGSFYLHYAAAAVALIITVAKRFSQRRTGNKEATDRDDHDGIERAPMIKRNLEHTEESGDSPYAKELQKEVRRLRKSQDKQNQKLSTIMNLMKDILDDETTIQDIMKDSRLELDDDSTMRDIMDDDSTIQEIMKSDALH